MSGPAAALMFPRVRKERRRAVPYYLGLSAVFRRERDEKINAAFEEWRKAVMGELT